jgi:hypothetical protein
MAPPGLVQIHFPNKWKRKNKAGGSKTTSMVMNWAPFFIFFFRFLTQVILRRSALV